MSFEFPQKTTTSNESSTPLIQKEVKGHKGHSESRTEKTSEISQAALAELNKTEQQPEKTIKLKQHEWNLNSDTDGKTKTETRADDVGKSTLLKKGETSEIATLNSQEEGRLPIDQLEALSEPLMEKPMEEMDENELMEFLEKQGQELEGVKDDDSLLENESGLQDKAIEEGSDKVTEGSAGLNEVMENIKLRGTKAEDLLKMMRVNVDGKLRAIELKPGENALDKINEHAGKFFIFESETNTLHLPQSERARIEAQGYEEVEDAFGNINQIPLDQIRFADDEEYEQFMKEIHIHIETLHNTAITPEESEPEEETEKNEGAKQSEQHAGLDAHENSGQAKIGKKQEAYSGGEIRDKPTGPTVAEMGRRRLEEFENYMNQKMEKIRKQIKQEELTEEQIKRDELKSSIKAEDAKRHETHVDIANSDAASKEIQRQLKSLSESTFSVPARKVFKELQVIFDKVNTLNPNKKGIVSIKKEILDVAKEVVKMSNEMKSVSEGSDRASGGGMI